MPSPEQSGGLLTWRTLLSRVLLLLCLVTSAAAEGIDIPIVLSGDGEEYHQVATRITERLRVSRHRDKQLKTLQAARLGRNGETSSLRGAELVVAVGIRALKRVLDGPVDFPVYAVLVPYASFDKLLGEFERAGRGELKRNVSALFLDQPPRRQLELARLFGDRFRVVGMLLGEGSEFDVESLAVDARRLGVALREIRISNSKALVPALKRAKRKIDLLMLMFDPDITNAQTVKQILYFSYHRHLPVLGYSRAMVRAGALAAVYSEPAQVGQQAAEEIIKALDGSPLRLPPRSFPKYYQATCNKAVRDYFNLPRDCGIDQFRNLAPDADSEKGIGP